MDHKTCRENLSAYLDGELPPREKALLETHLAGCPDCAAVLAGLRSVSGILKRNVMEPVPPSLKGEVLGGLNAKPFFSGWLKPVLALSTVAAGVLVVLNLEQRPERASLMQPKSAVLEPLPARRSGPAGLSEDAGQALSAESDKSYKYGSAAASARGSYGQAKFAAPRALGSLGGRAGTKAEAPVSPGPLGMSANKPPAAAEFRGPVCVYVSSARSREETAGSMGEEERDDFFWYLGKALLFLEKSGTPSPSAEPGLLVFVKKDGSRRTLTGKDCDLGFIFFDGVQDPLVVTDFGTITDQYNKYFGTSLEPLGDDLPD